MATKEQYNMQLIKENGTRSAVMLLTDTFGFGFFIRDHGVRVSDRELDLGAMGFASMGTYEMPDSNDRFELLYREDDDDEPAFAEIQLFLGWTDPTKSYYRKPEGMVPLMCEVWIPEDYFWDLSLLLPNEATLDCSWEEDPREIGDGYVLVDHYTMNCSPDTFEVYYSDKKRKDIADVRMSVFLGWADNRS